jgi:hypothetical protein
VLGAKPAVGAGDHDHGDAQHEPEASSISDATEWADNGDRRRDRPVRGVRLDG